MSDLPFTNEMIVELLPVIPSVTELSFAHCLMNQSVMVHFFQTLKECPSLTKRLQSLDIPDNTLGPDGSTALATWMNEVVPLNLSSINLAGTNPVWPVVITALQKREIIVRQLDISRNPIYDKVFSVLNPFIAGGHVVSLGVGDLKGDMIMTEGLCGSLLLNVNLKATTLILDNTPMDCNSVETVLQIDRFQERLISLVAQSQSLEALSIKNCQMDDACISMLCDVLVKYTNCKLRKLYLDGNLRIPEVGKCT